MCTFEQTSPAVAAAAARGAGAAATDGAPGAHVFGDDLRNGRDASEVQGLVRAYCGCGESWRIFGGPWGTE